MKIVWYSRKSPSSTNSGIQVVTSDVCEDAATTVVRERQFANVIDEIVHEHERQGGFDNLESKGKPLDLTEIHSHVDVSQRVLKNANILPKWLELQHQIRDKLKQLLRSIEQGESLNLDVQVDELNQSIREYNLQCPHPRFQKPLIQKDLLHQQLTHWE